MIKFLLNFLGVSHRIPWKKKNAIYRLEISALVPEIFKEVRTKFFQLIDFFYNSLSSRIISNRRTGKLEKAN